MPTHTYTHTIPARTQLRTPPHFEHTTRRNYTDESTTATLEEARKKITQKCHCDTGKEKKRYMASITNNRWRGRDFKHEGREKRK